jgi:putative transposase
MSGEKVEKARRKYGDRRRVLQQAATERRQNGKRPRSIRRKLARDKAKEARYKRDVNHCTTKDYVEAAKGTGRGISIEDLDGIGDRVTARGGDARNRLKGWSFFQFRTFLTYKALLAGVPLVVVDPAYTSQDCAKCGHRDRRNRKTQATFKCVSCGHKDNADVNAARNIRSRAIVMNAQSVGTSEGLPTEKPQASTGTSHGGSAPVVS